MGCLKLKMLASNACLKCATYSFCFFSFYLFVLIVDKKYRNASVFILFFLDYTVLITFVTFGFIFLLYCVVITTQILLVVL
jgi:hypothetical protein